MHLRYPALILLGVGAGILFYRSPKNFGPESERVEQSIVQSSDGGLLANTAGRSENETTNDPNDPLDTYELLMEELSRLENDLTGVALENAKVKAANNAASYLSSVDAQNALERFKESFSDRSFYRVVSIYAQIAFDGGSDEGKNWLIQLDNNPLNMKIASAAGAAIASDVIVAKEIAESLSRGPMRNEFSGPLLRTIASEEGISSALDAVDNLDIDESQIASHIASGANLGENEVELFSEIQKGEIELEKRSYKAFLVNWARRDPSELKNLVSEGANDPATVSALISGWSEGDPANASIWLNSLPEGSSKDHGIVELIRKIEKATPGDALEWAASISSPELRKDTTKAVYNNLRKLDSDTAAKEVDRLNLHQLIKE